MWLCCKVAVEEVELELVEAPVESWDEGGRGVLLTENVNGAEDGR